MEILESRIDERNLMWTWRYVFACFSTLSFS